MVLDDTNKTMLTIREASRLLNVHSNTLRRWSEQGIIRAYRIGPRGDRRFKKDEVTALLMERTRGTRTSSRRYGQQ